MQKNSRPVSAKDIRREIANPEIATTIISLVLNCSKSEAIIKKEIPAVLAKKCLKIAALHKKGEPIAYAAGKWFFCELPFHITKSVLVPRMDTEILITAVLNKTRNISEPLKILDICTGSGCIAIALAKYIKTPVSITAADVSRRALQTASKNAALNNVEINFLSGNFFNALENRSKDAKKQKGRAADKDTEIFDIITCNPPYIKTAEMGLHDKTILHEPHIALDGGTDGLGFYRRIAADAPKYLIPNGLLFLEIGHNQAAQVEDLLRAVGFYDVETTQDLNGLDRVITARCGRPAPK